MENVEVIMASKIIDLWKEWAQGCGVGTLCYIQVYYRSMISTHITRNYHTYSHSARSDRELDSQYRLSDESDKLRRRRPCTNMTHPELTRFITCIVPDFLDVCGVFLFFIRRDVIERNTSYVKNPVTLQLPFGDL